MGHLCNCDGAGARHLVRGLLRTWHVYMDVASPPSLAPQLNIFVIQHSFASSWKHLFKSLSRHLFNGLSRHSNTLYTSTCFHQYSKKRLTVRRQSIAI